MNYVLRGCRDHGRGPYYLAYGGHVFTDKAKADAERDAAARTWPNIAFDVMRVPDNFDSDKWQAEADDEFNKGEA